jgi:hypothetical protein
MSQNVIQPSFSAGELSPTLYARVDLAMYHVGAARMRNFFVDYRGGASTRQGTEFVARTFADTETIIYPFIFNSEQTYILEFGNQYIRFIRDGGLITQTPQAISSITQASPGVFTVTGHGFATGDMVQLTSIGGMISLNNNEYRVVVLSANTFYLVTLDNTIVNTIALPAYTGGGYVAEIVIITSPWLPEALPELKFVQSADVMSITHPDYAPRDLSRVSDTSWTLTTTIFGSQVAPPINLSGVASSTGSAAYAYVVTAVDTDGEESIASLRADVTGAVDINSVAGSIALSWIASPSAVSYYNLYKANYTTLGTIPQGVNLGFMGDTTEVSFLDTNIIPDFTLTPPLGENPFSGNYPSTVGYFQQRRVYAASNAQPETFWMSRTGHFTNFDQSNPVRPSDAITATLASRQVNKIKYMLAMPGGLVMLTSGGAWQVSGSSATSGISPLNVQATPQAYNGCADVEPIPINYDILYVQDRGSIVRNLSYNFYSNIYTGADLSIRSNHFFTNYNIVNWTYAEEPFKIVWAVRDDGALLSLTYLKEQEVIGWAQHGTQGLFEWTASVQEGNENAVYFVVRRYIGGRWLRYIERMASRRFDYGAEDAWSVDSALRFIGPRPASEITGVSGVTGSVVVTLAAGLFTVDDVGKIWRGAGGIGEITEVISAAQARVTLTRDIQITLEGGMVAPIAEGDWTLTSPTTTFTGLSHLEGQTVTILADGSVVTPQVVIDGTIELGSPATKVVIGLGYTCQLRTLYLDIGEPTIQGKRKKVAAVTVRVADSRGLQVGPREDMMDEIKERGPDAFLGEPIELITGDERIVVDPLWDEKGQIYIEQSNPLPATVLGVIPEIVVGDK